MTKSLRERASGLGIGPVYRNAWNEERAVPDHTLAALVATIGGDEAGPSRFMPAVIATTAGRGPACVEFRQPLAEPLEWRIDTEEGAALTGRWESGATKTLLPPELSPGYHRLHAAGAEALVIVAPQCCWQPESLQRGERIWGPAVQLYGLRSHHNWGIGDFSDLLHLVEQWAALGAGIVGVNPLSALFPLDAERASPYSPSSRVALNWLYLDVEAIEDFRESERVRRRVRAADLQKRLAALREAPLVDYAGVAAIKREVLEPLYEHFRARHLPAGSPRGRAFRDWLAGPGRAIEAHALHEALAEHLRRDDGRVPAWPAWPEAYRDPRSDAVRRFRESHADRIGFHAWLQWQADLQLAQVAARCKAIGLPVGLYLDLPVSVDAGGSDTWAHRDAFARDVSVGAPPDLFNLKGQDWGLPPLRPDRLRMSGYAAWITALRAAMRHAGALRIDHVMGMLRLYWIPAGQPASDGAYVHYRLDEMLAVLALESQRARCLVVGEDLGTVPDEVRAALRERGVLSYRILWFEREGEQRFRPSSAYPAQALAAVSTHDLPTLAGWWTARDIDERRRLDLFPDAQTARAQADERAHDRNRLAERLGLSEPVDGEALARAAHAFLAATPSSVMMVQPEDVLGVEEQANLPGTVLEHPNWRRKLPVRVEEMAADPRIAGIAAAIRRERPSETRAGSAQLPDAVIPRATYRLQLHRKFGFTEATGLVPYLARLGVSHVYCSPILAARPGSTHGYDVIDHAQVNPELGGREGFERFAAAVRASGLSLVLDIVPNHMAIGSRNAWWMDVLENGPSSAYADWFDIDWHPVDADLAGKVLLPILGDHYGVVLDRGELRLAVDAAAGRLVLDYFEHRLPLDPKTCAGVLRHAAQRIDRESATPAARDGLAAMVAALDVLPDRSAAPGSRDATLKDLRPRLAQLLSIQPIVAQALSDAIAAINGDAGLMHALLEAQAWRLAWWRVASDEINYRRFFDVNDLAALRMEHEPVFEATHALVLSLAAEGKVQGFRIDHSDGLHDPARYFDRLQQGHAWRSGAALRPGPRGRPRGPIWVVAEKITALHEHIPERWALHGTTGYDFAALAGGLFIDATQRSAVERAWRRFTGAAGDFDDAAYRGKKAVLFSTLASELAMLAARLLRIARADRRSRDFTLYALRQAIAEAAACLPVYRTYIEAQPSAQDRRQVEWALGAAAQRSRLTDPAAFGFLHEVLLARTLPGSDASLAPLVRRFAQRFQQFTAPLAAKGVEDTAFYDYTPLLSLNDVGNDPRHFGTSLREFHRANLERAARWPHAMLAGSTHDNKRSEDVRLRIAAVSERPAAWRLLLARWRTMNRSRVRRVDGLPAPSPADQYFFYQTLLGSFPVDPGPAELDAYRERVVGAMLKAARERKDRTSWINPDAGYERALEAFVRELLTRSPTNPFLDDLAVQARATAWFGALASLSHAALRYSAPGVPDLYQGDELLDYRLVDPDNRRPVDFALRRRLLDQVRALQLDDAAGVRELARTPLDGRAKLLVIARLLALRAERPRLFRDGGYEPLEVEGALAGHVVAFARTHAEGRLVVAVPRLHVKLLREPNRLPLGDVWGDTSLRVGEPGQSLRNVFTGEQFVANTGTLDAREVFESFPVAALIAD